MKAMKVAILFCAVVLLATGISARSQSKLHRLGRAVPIPAQPVAAANANAASTLAGSVAVPAVNTATNANAAVIARAVADATAAAKKASAKLLKDSIPATAAPVVKEKTEEKKEVEQEAKVVDKYGHCKNGGILKVDTCACTWEWQGTSCEHPSEAVINRRAELLRVEKLSDAILKISKTVDHMEKTGGVGAIASAVEKVTAEELKSFEASKTLDDFEEALTRKDYGRAETALNIAKGIKPSMYAGMRSRLDAQKALSPAAKTGGGIKQLPVPVMHTETYKNIDVSKAKVLDIRKWVTAKKVIKQHDAEHRLFTLTYGEPV